MAEIYAFCIEKNLANNLAVKKNTIIFSVEKNTNMRYVEKVQLGPIYFLLLLFYGELYQQQHLFGPKFRIKNNYIEWLGILKHSKFLSNLMINLSKQLVWGGKKSILFGNFHFSKFNGHFSMSQSTFTLQYLVD